MRRNSRVSAFLRARWLEVALLVLLGVIVIWYTNVGLGFVPKPTPTPTPPPTARPTRPSATATAMPKPVGDLFDGNRAYADVLAQTQLGPRPTGSQPNRQTQTYIAKILRENGWRVENQDFTYMNTPGRNVIGRAGKGPVVIIGAHYDTRRRADNDPNQALRNDPVPGANDGASGVAVLLELARSLDKSKLPYEVWLTFFDAQDDGQLDGWDFIAGSRDMAGRLSVNPRFVVIADMVGDASQEIYKEQNSTPALQERIWAIAAQLGYQQYFRPQFKYAMLDDHTPFLQRGIPAQDLIDFDYPYWHTTQDTADKISAASLERTGRVLQTLLQQMP